MNIDTLEAGFTVTWDATDSAEAIKHGWDVFTTEGTWQIQKIDCPEEGQPTFLTDWHACMWVWDNAKNQVPIAMKALQYIKEYSPNEYELMRCYYDLL